MKYTYKSKTMAIDEGGWIDRFVSFINLEEDKDLDVDDLILVFLSPSVYRFLESVIPIIKCKDDLHNEKFQAQREPTIRRF